MNLQFQDICLGFPSFRIAGSKVAALRCWLWGRHRVFDFRSRGDYLGSRLCLWLCSLKGQRHGEQLRLAHADVSQRADFLCIVVDVGSHLSKNHFVTELRVRELRRFFSNDLAHDLSDPMFLRTVDPPMAESHNVDPCKIIVDCSTGEDAVDTSASPPYEASQIVCRVLMTLEDRISPIAGDRGN